MSDLKLNLNLSFEGIFGLILNGIACLIFVILFVVYARVFVCKCIFNRNNDDTITDDGSGTKKCKIPAHIIIIISVLVSMMYTFDNLYFVMFMNEINCQYRSLGILILYIYIYMFSVVFCIFMIY